MQIKVINVNRLENKTACWGICTIIKPQYEVLAIKHQKTKRQYLVEDDMRLTWWDADLVNVIDETIPDDWIEVRYSPFYKLKNKNYNFNIAINYFCGPEKFLKNNNFLFDIYENPKIAYAFYKMQNIK